MANLQSTPYDSQRYDHSIRRQPSCLTVNSVGTNATEGHFPSSQYPGKPGKEHHKTSASPGGMFIPEQHLDARMTSRTSLAYSSSTLSVNQNVNSKPQGGHDFQQPSLRSASSRNILAGRDSNPNNARTPNHPEAKPNVEENITRGQTCFTDTYVHQDGSTATRTIIRPGGLPGRMRSLDCLRGTNNFEVDVDSILALNQQRQLQIQHQEQMMKIRANEDHSRR